jgi:hypothetical protein
MSARLTVPARGRLRDMAKWMCTCGETMQSSGPIPNPAEWLLVSDTDFDAFTGLVQADDVYANLTHSFRCPTCDRMHVFWIGFDNEPIVFAPEPQSP